MLNTYASLIVVVTMTLAHAAHAADLAVRVHAQGRADVTETRTLMLAGDAPSVAWAPINPRIDLDTVRIRVPDTDAPLPLARLRIVNDVDDAGGLVRRSIGKDVAVIHPQTGTRVTGKLLKADGTRARLLQLANGALQLDPVGELVLLTPPPLVTVPTLTCELVAPLKGKQPLQLDYQTSGLKWQALYTLCLDDTRGTAALTATVLLRNETEIDYTDAAWSFLATEKHKITDPTPMEEQRLVRYRPLGQQATGTLAARETVRLPLADAPALRVLTAYVFDPLADGPRLEAPAEKLQQIIGVVNAAVPNSIGLGVPLPSGKVKLSRRDVSGITEPLGEQSVAFTPVGEQIAVRIAAAKGLTGKRTASPFTELADERAQEQEIVIHLWNRTAADVTAEVVEHPWGRWSISDPSMEYEKLNDRTIRFDVPVAAGGEAEVRFRLRIKY